MHACVHACPAQRPPRSPGAQINYTWQALTLEASPYTKERTLSYVMDKVTAFSSLSSGSSVDLSRDE